MIAGVNTDFPPFGFLDARGENGKKSMGELMKSLEK
jgi:hypothetical protein